MGCAFLSDQKGTKESPGAGLRGVPALQSPAPGPPLRGTLAWKSYRESGAGGAADCPRFRAAAAGWILDESPAGWTKKARRLPPAVEAGSNSAGGETPPLQKALGITERGGEDTAPYKFL